VFEGFVPEISAPEVKALLQPVIDFGVKTSEQAYADTLPPKLRDAIAAHEVLVGMNHRMVLAAMGAPESKLREQQGTDGKRYEEWIYGHSPQTIHFVRFVGDRVTRVEIAALGKPLEVHDKNEMDDGYQDPADRREIAMGDRKPSDGDSAPAAPPPSLRLPGEAAPPSGQGKVQYPTDDKTPIPPPPGSDQTSPQLPSGPQPTTNPTTGRPNTSPTYPHLQ
jgi:hypothetical protein